MSADAQLSINTLRFLAIDAIEKSKSGHPGMPMGAAPMAYALWTRFLKFNPEAPVWADRDRFVLSAGHGSMLIYSLLHMSGYDVTIDDIKNFRQWGSRTPGHPEFGHTSGVETTTGPLGQGIAVAVGMAMAERHLAAKYNKPGFELVDHHTYAIAGDGCLMEGVSMEAVSLAGHLGLGKLVVLYDDNQITIEGATDLAFTEDVGGRFAASGWHVQKVADGNDVEAIASAIESAKTETGKPSLICIRTKIGYGSPKKQGTAGCHGSPLGGDEASATRKNLCWPYDETFFVPEGAKTPFEAQAGRGREKFANWVKMFMEYNEKFPAEAQEYSCLNAGMFPQGWDADLPVYPADAKGVATRVASGKALNAIAKKLPSLIGGSADLAPSNNSHIEGEGDFAKGSYLGRNIRFGVREHAMGAICNGMANHGGLRPYCATFFVFTDYMRPSIRLAALMGAPVIYVMTHDSFYLGEDGPTHQPIEHLASLRAMHGLSIIRPADANETSEAWRLAVNNTCGPTMLVLTRQNLPTLDRAKYPAASSIAKGGYVLSDCEGEPQVIIIATGSEVSLALKAQEKLASEGVKARVVNLASWDLFLAQSKEYREEVLPQSVKKRVSIEAGSTFGWEKFIGKCGVAIGIDHFGASAPSEVLEEKFGFTVENVVAKVKEIL